MIDRETASEIWRQQVQASNAKRETRDCTVKAISIACDVPYDDAHAALKAGGRRDRHGCRFRQQWPAIDALGFVVYDISDHVSGRTAITIERELRRRYPNGRCLIRVRGHLMAYRDGHIIDHAQGSRRRTCDVYFVVPKDAEQPRGYEFNRTRVVDETGYLTDEPYTPPAPVEPEPVVEPEPQPEPLTQKPRSRKVRRMTTKIKATGAEHPITSARIAFGLSTNQLGKIIGYPGASLWRLERGLNTPRAEVARELFRFFGGALPIGAIYDGPFWLDTTPDDERARVLARLGDVGQAYRGDTAHAAGGEPAQPAAVG